MKNYLPRELLIMSRLLFYGLFLQAFFISGLMAEESNAQYKSVYEINISLKSTNEPVIDILNKIEKKTNYVFTYNDKFMNNSLISINVQKQSVGEILESISRKVRLRFKQVNQNIHVANIENDQEQARVEVVFDRITVSGTVTDENGEGLPGVSIVIKGTTNGTTTDLDGNYTISADNGNDVLIFSFIGYTKQEVPINNQSVIDVQLEIEDSYLDEVTVVGYKTVPNREVTGAVTSIQTKELENIPTPSILGLLAGKAPGVHAIVRSGLPGGSGGGLVIRGNTNLSAASDVTGLSNPLYIVDGVPMALSDFAGFDVSQNDFFATLDPNNIESIDILKDAAATAIYGSRGANGVVIIKTKRGNATGKAVLTFSSAAGVNFQPEKLPVFIGEAERQEKLRLYDESLSNLFGDQAPIDVRNGLEVGGYLYPSVLTDKFNPAFNNAYDYQDLFYQNGFNQQYDLSMSGGNEDNAFRVGLGYYDEKGVLVGFGFSRLTLNASLTSDINPKLHNDLSIRFVHLNRKGGQSDNLRSFPTSPTNLPSSLFYRNQNELDLFSGKLADTNQANKTYQVTVNEGLRISLAEGLTWDNQAAVSANFGRKNYFVPSTAADNRLSNSESSFSDNVTINAHSVLSYFKTVGDHEFTALAGTEINLDRQSITVLSGEGGPSDYIQVIQGFQKENVNGYSDIVKSNLLSYFGNVSYGYKNRYKIELVLRRDASSRFGENNKWATFPSARTYWIFSDEPWMQPINNVLKFGKLRLSYGQSGSIEGDPLLQYNSLIATSNIGAGINDIYNNQLDVKTYGGNSLLISDFNKIANRTLSWSKSSEINYGLDLHFYEDRIYLTADAYSRQIEGLVFVSGLSPYVGYSSIRSNLVDMISNGWELGVTGYLFPRGNEFQWELNVNLARNRTVVDKLGNGGRDYISGEYAFVEGEPAFQYYTYEYLGPLQNEDDLPVNPLTGEPLKYYGADAGLALNKQGKIFAGMPLFTDVNGDYMIDGGDYGLDKKIIEGKSPEPKILGGFNTTLKYKSFSLTVQSSFAFGHYIFNTSLQQMLSQYDDQIAFFTNALYDLSDDVDFWEEPGDNAEFPLRYITYSDGGSARSFRQSSMFIEKGDYWSIDNIILTYNLPQAFTQKIGLNRVSVYTTLRNAYMWKASRVPDPRVVSKTGYYNGQGYPISRNLVLGLNVNF